MEQLSTKKILLIWALETGDGICQMGRSRQRKVLIFLKKVVKSNLAHCWLEKNPRPETEAKGWARFCGVVKIWVGVELSSIPLKDLCGGSVV